MRYSIARFTYVCALSLPLLFALKPIVVQAGKAAKVQVCHIPLGNPANFHTITINQNALQSHLDHGDFLGSCAEHCETLCDDGNACTQDACDPNTGRCLATHPPVDCNDENPCTVDSCNPTSGCENVAVDCSDGNACTVDTCDQATGECLNPPVMCTGGESCDPTSGECVALCTAQQADSCDPNIEGQCCSGLTCTSLGGIGTFCAAPSGAPCDIFNPRGCQSACCKLFSNDPLTYVCC